MTKFNPLVSIIIPVYNGSNYLKEAIDSALAQTYKNIEVIVVNDGSNDNGATEKIAKSYGNKIRYFKKKNGGVATALNLGIEKMKGDYFSWLSHDDLYYPNKIERQINFLRRLDDKEVVLYADYDLIDEHGQLTAKCVKNHKELQRVPIYSLLRGSINGITMLMPKKVFETHGNFDVGLRCTQDYDMWFRLIDDYEFVHQPEIIAQTRLHSQQSTVTSPVVISEGNELWIKMVQDTADDVKIAAEGDLVRFYLEMVKFMETTPYDQAAQYCQIRLKKVAKDKKTKLSHLSVDEIVELFNTLKKENQTPIAALVLSNAITQYLASRQSAKAVNLITTVLVGDVPGLNDKHIKRNYLANLKRKSSKKKIMFCSGHWLTGGMERVMSILFEQLKDNYEIYLLTPQDERKSSIAIPNYVIHFKISNDHFKDFDSVALSHAVLFQIDVVIGFMNMFALQLQLYDLCRELGIKTIASNHEIFFYPYTNPDFYYVIPKRLMALQNVDAALWPTNFSATAYGLLAENSYLLPNPNTFEIQEGNIAPTEKIVLCVGRFDDPVKRIDRILECFAFVSRRVPDAKLVLVGKYNRTTPLRLKNETTINGLLKYHGLDESQIEFVGEVNDVARYYAKASLLLLVSESEGFGVVINEAACFGVPTVCNRIPGLEDLVIDGYNGLMIDQDDIESLADAVESLLIDTSLRRRLSQNAKRYVKKFSSKEIGRSWRFLIDTILSKASSEQKQAKLRKRLDYKVESYRAFSKLLMVEMGKIAEAGLKGQKDTMFTRNLKRLARLKISLRDEGYLRTVEKITRKVGQKLSALWR